MKNLLKLLLFAVCLLLNSQIQAQFSINAGPSFPLADLSSSNKDFGNAQIGVYASLQGAMPVTGNTDVLGHMFAITLNVDYFWHTLKKDAQKRLMNEYLEKNAVMDYDKMTHTQYMFLPIMIGFMYRYNFSNNFAIAVDAACGVNFIYRTKEEFDFVKDSANFQSIKEYKLAYGLAARATFRFIILKHFSLGVNVHLLNSFTNNYSTYIKREDVSEPLNNVSYSSPKGYSVYPMSVSAFVGYVF